MKKTILSFLLMIFMISCEAQIALNQFNNGDYVSSVKTTVSYLGVDKFNGLKEDERSEILSRLNYIDNYYSNIINDSSTPENINNMVDAISIVYYIEKSPQLKQYVNYLVKGTADVLIDRLNNAYQEAYSNSYDKKYTINKLYEAQMKLKNLGLIRSEYAYKYQVLAKNLANIIFYYQGQLSDLRLRMDYLKKVINVYGEYDPNYLDAKNIYIKIEKQLNVSEADKLFNNAQDALFRENFDSAISNFEKAYNIYSRYSDLYNKQQNAKYYLDMAKTKQKEKKAEELYQSALKNIIYADIQTALKQLKEVDKIIPNYKDVRLLLSKYANYDQNNNNINYNDNYNYNNWQNNNYTNNYNNTFSIITNNSSKRINDLISKFREAGYVYSNYGSSRYNISYSENVEYKKTVEIVDAKEYKDYYYYDGVKLVTRKYTEILTIKPILSFNYTNIKQEDIIMKNEYYVVTEEPSSNNTQYNTVIREIRGKELGQKQMLEKYNKDINNIVYNRMIRLFK